MRLYSLLKNSMRGTVRVVRRFSAAYKPFILVIPNPASAGEGSAFRVFQQTVQPLRDLAFLIRVSLRNAKPSRTLTSENAHIPVAFFISRWSAAKNLSPE